MKGKNCPKCGSNHIKKNGHMRGKQWYKCTICTTRFFGKQKLLENVVEKLWQAFVWRRQTLENLAETFGKSKRWVRYQLEAYQPIYRSVLPQAAVFVADATFFKREYGFLVYRIPTLKKNPYAPRRFTPKPLLSTEQDGSPLRPKDLLSWPLCWTEGQE